ncbi:hypothetical protein SBA3_3860005 [Candidatus Sulfopaludibacter sp. SbA3]|nr:hypothetical protein SBA3_3860005 [Candidatus Sulfopaludibacter sp. SbA3]
MEVQNEALMKIRYQNGNAIEGITLSRTEQTLRVAVRGCDDAMEFTNIHGTWVSEDCEPVIVEVGMSRKAVEDYCDDAFLCPQELARHLVSLLYTDSSEDFLNERSLLRTGYTGVSTLIA